MTPRLLEDHFGLTQVPFPKTASAAALLRHPALEATLERLHVALHRDTIDRLLTTNDFDRRSPFALVLVGQPLLRERLAEPQHYALAQRLGVRLRLRPLTESEVPRFIARHLTAAGARTNPFEPATTALFHHTRGIPRLVQNVALAAMLAALEAGKTCIDATTVQQAVVDWETV